jgi:hypothetical protein
MAARTFTAGFPMPPNPLFREEATDGRVNGHLVDGRAAIRISAPDV